MGVTAGRPAPAPARSFCSAARVHRDLVMRTSINARYSARHWRAAKLDGAARLAALAAERLGVPLQVIVAHEPLPVYDYAFGATNVPTPEDNAAICGALVVEATDQLRQCGVTGVTPAVRTGFVAQQIADAARELRSELIVAGLGPHNVANRALGGERHSSSRRSRAHPCSRCRPRRRHCHDARWSQSISVLPVCAPPETVRACLRTAIHSTWCTPRRQLEPRLENRVAHRHQSRSPISSGR